MARKKRETTRAFKTYKVNVGRIAQFFRMAIGALHRRMKQLDNRITSGKTKNPRASTLKKYTEATGFGIGWVLVSMVTAVETYLVDLMADCAAADASLMAESEQAAPYSDVIAADSVEDLATELRRRWARGFLDRGGPRVWIDRLTRMGATGYAADTAERMELVWGVRHVIVHSAGVVTKEFLQRHPTPGVRVGDEYPLDTIDSKTLVAAMTDFVRNTDIFWIARLGASAKAIM